MRKLRLDVRVTEADTLSDALVRLYKAEKPLAEDAYLKNAFAEVETLSSRLTTAIKSDRASSRLDEADLARDEIIKNLSDALKGYAALPIPAKKAAAEMLLATFNKYGRAMTAESYASESSLIESMLEDFAAEGLKEAISALDGIAEFLRSLRTAQDEFNKANDEWTAASAAKGESATAIKKRLVAAINGSVVPYLTAMTLADGARYAGFAGKVEAEIEKANGTVARRGTPKRE